MEEAVPRLAKSLCKWAVEWSRVAWLMRKQRKAASVESFHDGCESHLSKFCGYFIICFNYPILPFVVFVIDCVFWSSIVAEKYSWLLDRSIYRWHGKSHPNQATSPFRWILARPQDHEFCFDSSSPGLIQIFDFLPKILLLTFLLVKIFLAILSKYLSLKKCFSIQEIIKEHLGAMVNTLLRTWFTWLTIFSWKVIKKKLK